MRNHQHVLATVYNGSVDVILNKIRRQVYDVQEIRENVTKHDF
jgi:hypothetical protein